MPDGCGQQSFAAYALGQWDETLRGADEFIAECEAGSPHYLENGNRRTRGLIRAARGDPDGALADLRRALELAREAKDPQARLPTLDLCVGIFEAHGSMDDARELVHEAIELARRYPHGATWGVGFGISFSRSLAGFEDELREILELAPAGPWKELVLVCLDREFVRAAEIWAEAGTPTWEARLRLRAAEDLVETGRRAEGEEQARRALAFYRTVGATFYIERGEALLAKAKSA